ncbi:hypothetical protein LT85_1553 [Collimonas arenae]|uniref:L,D-transpeptidase n=1 Tax=Collimonas arenae TaxID=279058 RepID=A0A0A1F882_9BURK|nr:hypothetical protein [Collimonas arenae]AIY40711.1 hypothetical protein LT85_1553 [Collimonas arenae]
MNTLSKSLVAATLLATMSMSAVPAMAAGAAKQAAVKPAANSTGIPLLMPPIVIIGKRLTPEEKAMYAAQDRAQNMKKIARKKNANTATAALSAL